jgi:hypothetical protein
MLKGEIRRAVRYLTEREKFNVLQPSSETGNGTKTVMAVFQAKHPPPKQLQSGELPSFPEFPTTPPPFSNLDITEETVAKTATKLSGACARMDTLSRAGSYTTANPAPISILHMHASPNGRLTTTSRGQPYKPYNLTEVWPWINSQASDPLE